MKEKKLTQRDYYKMLLAITDVANNEELVNFINGRIEQLDKKASGNSEKSEELKALHNAIEEEVIATLESNDKGMTISGMQKANEELAQYSNQRLNQIITRMNKEGRLVRTMDKRKAYFSLA